ncbi:theg spermatid protein isoform X2 [Betta splendens]|uniref:Theg spermatid protein isoform X2 n=1 Tax=Betta splendens TaxID=158456 RepID=A0A6P7LML2_BETSP|nr:theg spermatid protein isoform X2 [Betta splendens]
MSSQGDEQAAAGTYCSVSMATRIHQLAQPKPSRLQYPDRRSVYWLNEPPPETTASTTRIELTPRWLALSQCKKHSTQLIRSPEWEVSEWALRAVPSERLCSLAQPWGPAAGWQPARPLLTPLSRATQTAVASSRICQLARPRARWHPGASDHGAHPAAGTHLPYKASAHTELLATPKRQHPMFKGERPLRWAVSRAVMNHKASQRVLELSGPKERRALFDGYDPYAVSRAARSASASARVQQLCLPLPRKCSSDA